MTETISWEEIRKLSENICETADLPGFSETVETIANLGPENDLSAQELAALILKDYGLTSKVIRMANSAFYNPSGTEITTVSRAIVYLGLNPIKEIALATSLFETVMRETPTSRREKILKLLSQSYLCAYICRQLAEKTPYEDEELFVCSLLYQIVRIVLAVYHPGAYQRLLKREASHPDSVQRMLFRLAEKVADCWSLPPSLLYTLEGSPRSKTPGTLAHFVGQMNQAIFELIKDGDVSSLKKAVENLKVSPEETPGLIGKAIEAIKQLSPQIAMEIPSLDSPKQPEPPQKTSEGDFYFRAISEISASLASRKYTYEEILLMVSEALCRGLTCETVALSIMSLDRRRLIIRYGLGPKAQSLKGEAIPTDNSLFQTIFSLAKEWTGSIEQLPEAGVLEKLWPRRQVLISPLVISDKPVGAFLCLRGQSFGAEDCQKAEALKNLAILAITTNR